MSDVQIVLASDSVPAQFDPHAYTIIVKRVILDGEPVFHGRVVELPDLEAFEPTYEEAYNFIVDGIRSSKAAFDEQGRQFPTPLPDETPEFSGRVTIRMPSWLHAQLDYSARAHQTSLNQYMVTLLSWAATAAPEWIAQSQAVAPLTWIAGMSVTSGTGTATFSTQPVGNQVSTWFPSSAASAQVGEFLSISGLERTAFTYTPRVAKPQLARSARRLSK